jgi:hypothetical protein
VGTGKKLLDFRQGLLSTSMNELGDVLGQQDKSQWFLVRNGEYLPIDLPTGVTYTGGLTAVLDNAGTFKYNIAKARMGQLGTGKTVFLRLKG